MVAWKLCCKLSDVTDFDEVPMWLSPMEVLNTRGVGKINDRQLTLYKMGAWFLCKVNMKLHYLLNGDLEMSFQ